MTTTQEGWHEPQYDRRREAAEVVRGDRMARRPRLPGRRNLAVLRAQVGTDTLVDLERLGWPPLTETPSGLEIAATCKIVELHDFKGPPEWRAVPLFDKCIDAFLMSFKIWNAATVGGNVVHVPAGRRHDLADRRARRRLQPVAAQRQAARGPGRRLRHRHAHQRAAEGRAPALDLPARVGADQALRHAPGVAHPPSAARPR